MYALEHRIFHEKDFFRFYEADSKVMKREEDDRICKIDVKTTIRGP